MSVNRCACGATLGTLSQGALPGTGVTPKCAACVTKDRIRHVLAMLPDRDDEEFERLSEFEQEFLPSVREQFERRGTLSEKQIEILERIYAKA